MLPTLLANSCLNVGGCGHMWVVVSHAIDGPLMNTPGRGGSNLVACPSCAPDSNIWGRDKPGGYMVGGLERARRAHK